jgi:hypothetical protein
MRDKLCQCRHCEHFYCRAFEASDSLYLYSTLLFYLFMLSLLWMCSLDSAARCIGSPPPEEGGSEAAGFKLISVGLVSHCIMNSNNVEGIMTYLLSPCANTRAARRAAFSEELEPQFLNISQNQQNMSQQKRVIPTRYSSGQASQPKTVPNDGRAVTFMIEQSIIR